MNRRSHRSVGPTSVLTLLIGLACAQAPLDSAANPVLDDYLQLASHHHQDAERYRKLSLQHRSGRFHSRREHNRLLALAAENDRAAVLFEQLAKEIPSTPESAPATPRQD